MRRTISTGSIFEQTIGYSRAVVDGDWVFVSGTTGFDYATMRISDDVGAQAEQALHNIEGFSARPAALSRMSCASATFCLTLRISKPAGQYCGGISAR